MKILFTTMYFFNKNEFKEYVSEAFYGHANSPIRLLGDIQGHIQTVTYKVKFKQSHTRSYSVS
jgi:hypothetical protein